MSRFELPDGTSLMIVDDDGNEVDIPKGNMSTIWNTAALEEWYTKINWHRGEKRDDVTDTQ